VNVPRMRNPAARTGWGTISRQRFDWRGIGESLGLKLEHGRIGVVGTRNHSPVEMLLVRIYLNIFYIS
jgi:hypothetical protein